MLIGVLSRSLRRVGLDAALALIGVLVALPSLALPLGRDQGLYFYVAREWVERGALPYKDVFEQKTPGIYLLHATCIGLFGKVVWGIRVFDLLMVVALGVAAVIAACGRDRSAPRGLYGVAILATSILYYGCFDFWDTAQCELGCALFAMASLASARAIVPPMRSAWVCGLFAGLALLFKPPGLFMIAIPLWLVWRRPVDRRTRMLVAAAFVGAAAAPLLLVFGYLTARGALPATIDVVVHANGYYAVHEGINDVTEVFSGVMAGNRTADPLSSVLLAATIAAWIWSRRRDDVTQRSRHALVLALGLAAYAGVIVQKKFFTYHFGLVVGPGALAVACLALTAVEAFPKWRTTIPATALCMLVLFLMSRGFETVWFAQTKQICLYETGHVPRADFVNFFRRDFMSFYPREAEATGVWLREHSNPDDLVLVRGMEPEIYITADRRWAGRFFWSSWLTSPSRAYRRESWLAEDRADVERLRPRFVVAISNAADSVDAEATYVGLGYQRRTIIDPFIIMERP